MKIGVSGHRHREGADWEWVRGRIAEIVAAERNVTGWSSLAVGADMLFAETVLAYGGKHVAVLPGRDYASDFEAGDRSRFEALCARSRRKITLRGATGETTYQKAGELIVRKTDLMIFVWDGKPAEGPGGTGDIVAYAKARRTKMIWLDPIERRATEEFA